MLSIFLYYGGGALLILRIILGAILIAHGWPKIKDLKQTAANFEQMGFKPGRLFGTIAALLEFFGGIGLVLGFLVSVIAAFLILEFIVIVGWRISKGHAFVGGWEFELLILAVAIVLFALGGGSHALDRMFFF